MFKIGDLVWPKDERQTAAIYSNFIEGLDPPPPPFPWKVKQVIREEELLFFCEHDRPLLTSRFRPHIDLSKPLEEYL